MTEEAQIPAQVLNNKNKHEVRCQFCHLLILKPQLGGYLEEEFRLPLLHQKQCEGSEPLQTDLQRHFWVVKDMFTFENIGFSNTVGNRKYLICAECDMGPVGYHDIENNKCFIALKRVRHGAARPPTTAGAMEKPAVYA